MKTNFPNCCYCFLPINIIRPRIVDIREVDVSGLPRDSTLEWRLNHLKDGHFKLVMPQLKQIRKALQLAKLLDRTLIIPQVLSGYDIKLLFFGICVHKFFLPFC